jgi:hypothetical protein
MLSIGSPIKSSPLLFGFVYKTKRTPRVVIFLRYFLVKQKRPFWGRFKRREHSFLPKKILPHPALLHGKNLLDNEGDTYGPVRPFLPPLQIPHIHRRVLSPSGTGDKRHDFG